MVKRKHSNFNVYDEELNALYKSVIQGRRPGSKSKPPDAIMSDPLPSIPGVPKGPPKITRKYQYERPGFGGDVTNTETGEKGFFDMKGNFRQRDEPYCYHDGCNRICRSPGQLGGSGYTWMSTAKACGGEPNPNAFPDLDFVPPRHKNVRLTDFERENMKQQMLLWLRDTRDSKTGWKSKLLIDIISTSGPKRKVSSRTAKITKLRGQGHMIGDEFIPWSVIEREKRIVRHPRRTSLEVI
jgi:hypothetical protein